MSVSGRIRFGRPWLLAAVLAGGLAAAVHPAQATTRPELSLRALRLHFAHDLAAGRILGGLTAQGWPVVLAVSKNEKQVVGTVAGIVLSCSSGQQFPIEDAWARLRIGPAGTVRTSAVIHTSGTSSGTAITGGSHSMQGKLNRKTGDFSGVWHVALSFTTSSGPDQCDSGNVAFRLKL
jgi:hypothetical protein